MKTQLIQTILILSLLLPGALARGEQDLVQTDQNGVQNSGNKNQGARAVKLEPGLYYLNDIDQKLSVEYYLLLDTYANDPEKSLAILFSVDAVRNRRSVAYLYQGRPIKNGSVVMFSPLAVDNSGNMRVLSEGQTNAPVIELMERQGNHRFPYVLRGRNGALGGRILGMRGASSKKPELKPWPSTGIFASTTGKDVDILVNGSEVSINSGSLADQTFSLLAINGEQGKFAALTKSTLDTMSENELADERIVRLASFISGCFDRETMMILSPTMNWGEYHLDTYQLAEPSFLDWLFPGRKSPR